MSTTPPPVMLIDGVRTLPLYCMFCVAIEDIPGFGSGKVKFTFEEPELEPSPFRCDQDTLERASNDWNFALSAIKAWNKYAMKFTYFCQFKDDPSRALVTALNDHSELLSRICDIRLGLDPTPFGRVLFDLFRFSITHGEYRADPDREKNYDYYAEMAEQQHNELFAHRQDAEQLCSRMQRVMDTKRADWTRLTRLFQTPQQESLPSRIEGLTLFCSYSHKDESLRGQLEAHLSLLRRQKLIAIWHDRKITAGNEWKGEISTHLARSDIILLLVSADFINSDYCYDVEMNEAMKQHEHKVSRVIPVIARASDWHEAPFGKLQALPKDGRPITSWENIDEAFLDVSKGLRFAVDEIKRVKAGAS